MKVYIYIFLFLNIWLLNCNYTIYFVHYIIYIINFISTLLILVIESSLHWLFKYSALRCLYLLLNLKK